MLALLGSPHLCSRAFITEQYDRYVRGNTVLAEHADGGVLRVDEATGRGIAVSTDASGRYTQLDPYTGAQLALAEAYRNVAVTGATPVAVTNCLNFGSPEDPAVMWQFSQAVRGLADGCAALGIPVTGGNVSFYNQTGTTPILPTPVVGVLGVIDDVKRRIPTGTGHRTGGDADPARRHPRRVRRLDLGAGHRRPSRRAAAEGRPGPREAARRGAGRRVARRAGIGCARSVRGWADAGRSWRLRLRAKPVAASLFPRVPTHSSRLFSESAGRVLVAVPRTEESRFRAMCEARGSAGHPHRRRGPRQRRRSKYKACSRFPWRTCAARRRACFPGCSGDRARHANDTRYSSGRGAWSASTSSASRSARCSSACR